jgi:RHS repeat-associated protein
MLYRTSDKLGSAVLIINASGLVIESNRTLPYGEAWLAENTPSTNDKKFTSYQRDQESGMDYAEARYYANAAGRFNSPDKGRMLLVIPSSLNRYAYAGLDPINITDQTGNEWGCGRNPETGRWEYICDYFLFKMAEPGGGGGGGSGGGGGWWRSKSRSTRAKRV